MWTLINKKSVVKDITSFKSIKIFGVTFWNTTFFSIWPFSQLKKGESVKLIPNLFGCSRLLGKLIYCIISLAAREW